MTDKTIMLEGKALEIGAELHDLFWESNRRQADLRAEFERKMEQEQRGLQMKLHEAWLRLLREVGLAHAKVDDWGLDARYWPQHGVMFLNPNNLEIGGADLAEGAPTPDRRH